jgi:hypothetical protein
MGMQPSISYKGKEGAPRFIAMERAIAIDRPFTMSEFEGSEDEIRYLWDHDYMMIIGADPLTFEVTKYGRDMVAREYEKMKKDRLKAEREAMLEQEIAA